MRLKHDINDADLVFIGKQVDKLIRSMDRMRMLFARFLGLRFECRLQIFGREIVSAEGTIHGKLAFKQKG